MKSKLQWIRDNIGKVGGGRLISVKGARFDDHRDTAKKIREEREHRSQQSSSFTGGCSFSQNEKQSIRDYNYHDILKRMLEIEEEKERHSQQPRHSVDECRVTKVNEREKS